MGFFDKIKKALSGGKQKTYEVQAKSKQTVDDTAEKTRQGADKAEDAVDKAEDKTKEKL